MGGYAVAPGIHAALRPDIADVVVPLQPIPAPVGTLSGPVDLALGWWCLWSFWQTYNHRYAWPWKRGMTDAVPSFGRHQSALVQLCRCRPNRSYRPRPSHRIPQDALLRIVPRLPFTVLACSARRIRTTMPPFDVPSRRIQHEQHGQVGGVRGTAVATVSAKVRRHRWIGERSTAMLLSLSIGQMLHFFALMRLGNWHLANTLPGGEG